jgi:hypothetical protein
MNDLQYPRISHGIGPPYSRIAHAPASARLVSLSFFMSSTEPPPVSTTPPSAAPIASSLPSSTSAFAGGHAALDGAPRVPGADSDVPLRETDPPLSTEQVREVVRLMQCPVCSHALQEPVTLPCGRTLCKRCVPDTHLRANISYPATESRLQGFECPFAGCEKEHAIGDCGIDVTLNKAMAVAQSELGKGREASAESGLTTHVTAKAGWEAAGVPFLREPEHTSQTLPGGRLLATYGLVESGDLDYNAEITFESAATREHEKLDAAVLTKVKEVVRTEMDCQVCYALYYDPVTTPCGHTFCRACLQRVVDHARYCPVCRRTLTIQPMLYRSACPTNQLITNITTAFWSDLLEARKQVIATEASHDGNNEYNLAIFVCTLSFPQMPTFLHIFEPRYRLMIRRALEGDRMFGMVLYQGSSSVALGTVLRIANAEFFPDGRSLIETVGVSRFRILRHAVLDGYMVARTERINDISIAEEEDLEASETNFVRNAQPSRADVVDGEDGGTAPSRFPSTVADIESTPTSDLMDFAVDFVRRMREQSVGWLTARMLAIYGECPRDPALFPWWFGSVLPVRDMEKYRLLGTTSVRDRLKICCAWILEWERSRW